MTRNLSLNGFTGGLQIGANWQFANIVVGIEADANFMSTKKSYATPNFPGALGGTWNANGASAINGFGTLRARAGVVVGNALISATGGLAVVDHNFSQRLSYLNVAPPPPQEIPPPRLPLTTAAGGLNSGAQSKSDFGFALGAGVEYQLTANWSVKGEYLYIGLNNLNASSRFVSTTPLNYDVTHRDNKNSLQVARLGVNFKF